jgi:GT2 family glycosyltransferase
MTSQPPVVSVIIVSYNTRDLTLDCLRTVTKELDREKIEVFVVDNASQDDSVAAIRAEFPDVKLIANERNVGFGTANNQAMQTACGRTFLLLNSDAFPKPGAVSVLISYLDSHPEVAAVGPRLLNADGTLQRSCFRLPSPGRAWLENLWLADLLYRHPTLGEYRRWPHDVARNVDFVSGACMLIRREVWDRIGGFDEDFFLYAEETDWQRRMRDAGWQIAFTPAAEVVHLGGESGKGDRVRISRLFFDGLDRYVRKHHGVIGLVSMRLAMLVGCSLRALLWIGVFAAAPKRRPIALGKVKLFTWLCVRQATHWQLKTCGDAPPLNRRPAS